MTYRHITNARVPFDALDLSLFMVLDDYRIGDPIPAKVETALSMKELKARNIVGLYIKPEVLASPALQKKTGWKNPKLGAKWVP